MLEGKVGKMRSINLIIIGPPFTDLINGDLMKFKGALGSNGITSKVVTSSSLESLS